MLEELRDLQRRMANAVHFGTVEEVQHKPPRAKVRVGENVTTWVPWTANRSGGRKSWSPLSVGEQVVLVAMAGDLNQAAIVGTIPSNANPAPGETPELEVFAWEDGARLEYDEAAHAYRLTVPDGGSVRLAAGQASVELTPDGVALRFGGKSVVLTADGLAITGDMSVDGDLAAGNITASGTVTDSDGDGGA